MSQPRVVWHAHARADLLALYIWIAAHGDADTALAYTSGIEAHAASLAEFPHRGRPRDDIARGIGTILYRRRTIIAYRATDRAVEILRLVHAGQDWDSTKPLRTRAQPGVTTSSTEPCVTG